MKIETLLRAYERCFADAEHCPRFTKYKSCFQLIEARKRQAKTIRKGIIRKFERLERKNKILLDENIALIEHLNFTDINRIKYT